MKIKALGGDDLDHALVAALPKDFKYIIFIIKIDFIKENI